MSQVLDTGASMCFTGGMTKTQAVQWRQAQRIEAGDRIILPHRGRTPFKVSRSHPSYKGAGQWSFTSRRGKEIEITSTFNDSEWEVVAS